MPDAAARLVILGGGGHAKVVIELARAARPDLAIVGLLDPSPDAKAVLGTPVIGGDEALGVLAGAGVRHAFVALGDNALRARLGEHVLELGFELVTLISPRAAVSPSARIGRGVAVMAGAVINAEAEIGDLAIVNTGAVVDHDCRLGPACHLAPGATLAGVVTLGARSLMGVGASAIPGVRIGEDTLVGAGACVTADLPPGVLALGVPARVQRPLS